MPACACAAVTPGRRRAMTSSQLAFRVWRVERPGPERAAERRAVPKIGRLAGELSFESRRRNADDGHRGACQAQTPADGIDASAKRALPGCHG